MLSPGDLAPSFALPSDSGSTLELPRLLHDGPIVLYFYPADFTPLCTRQACLFRDRYADLVTAGVRVYGVSPQGPDTHAQFRAAHHIPFPLLCDADKSVARAYGAVGPFGLGTRRVSYLIGRDGRVKDAAEGNFSLKKHDAFVGRVLAAVRPARPLRPAPKATATVRG